jgi:hypothetical protein
MGEVVRESAFLLNPPPLPLDLALQRLAKRFSASEGSVR